MTPPVRQERTGWRDLDLSKRHRMWGFNCPAVDLDFLMVEYNLGKPVGLIEYKHFKAQPPNLKHPTYRALVTLATMANLPFMIAFYWPGIWAFRVIPVNEKAKESFKLNEELTEQEFVRRLYAMRYRVVNEEVLKRLKTEKPPAVEPLEKTVVREQPSDKAPQKSSPAASAGETPAQPQEAAKDKTTEKAQEPDDLPF